MEEAVETIILLVVLVTFAVVAYAYVLPLSYAQLRGAEIRSAIGVMLTFSDQTVRLVEGDSTGSVDFAFPYGVFDVSSNGNVSILLGDRVCDCAESRAAKELGFGARMSECSLMPARN